MWVSGQCCRVCYVVLRLPACGPSALLQDDNKEKEKLKAGLTGAILTEKPNVKVSWRFSMRLAQARTGSNGCGNCFCNPHCRSVVGLRGGQDLRCHQHHWLGRLARATTPIRAAPMRFLSQKDVARSALVMPRRHSAEGCWCSCCCCPAMRVASLL